MAASGGGLVRVACGALLLWLSVASCAGAPQTLQAPRATQQPLLLWHVEGRAGTEGSLHILGSIHIGPEGGLAMDARIERTFAAADALVVEVDTTALAPEEMARILLERGLLPPGESVRDRVSPKTFALLVASLETLDNAPPHLLSFEPWAVAIALLTLRFEAQGFDPDSGVDHHFLTRASELGKPIVSLETLEFQFGLFDGLSPTLQETLLLSAIRESEDAAQEAEVMIDAWEQGDAEALERLIFAPLAEHPEFEPLYEVIYSRRNRSMVRTLEALLAEKKAWFVVVGAGHLVGDGGIVALLSERGYRVRRLMREH